MSQGTKIIKCTCSNEFQDKEYGKNNRVHNHADKKGAEKDYRYMSTKFTIYSSKIDICLLI